MCLVLEAELDAMKILLHFILTPDHASILLHILQVRKLEEVARIHRRTVQERSS